MEMQLPKLTPDDPQVDIKEQFKQGPPQQPETIQYSPEEELRERERLTEIFDRDLPFMKKQWEYDDMQIKLLEQAVLLNRRPISSIPGLLGMELAIREVKAKEFLGQYANEMQHRIEQEQERLRKEQEAKSTEPTPDTQAPGNNATTN